MKLSYFIIYTPLIKHKTGLLNLAEEPSNRSQACKLIGFTNSASNSKVR